MAIEPTDIQSGEEVYYLRGNLPAKAEVSNTSSLPEVATQTNTYFLKGEGSRKFTTDVGKANSIYTIKQDFIDAITDLINDL